MSENVVKQHADDGNLEPLKPANVDVTDEDDVAKFHENDVAKFHDPWQRTEKIVKGFADTFKEARRLENAHQHALSRNYMKNLKADLGEKEFAARVEIADGRRKRKAEKKKRRLQDKARGQTQQVVDAVPGKNHLQNIKNKVKKKERRELLKHKGMGGEQ